MNKPRDNDEDNRLEIGEGYKKANGKGREVNLQHRVEDLIGGKRNGILDPADLQRFANLAAKYNVRFDGSDGINATEVTRVENAVNKAKEKAKTGSIATESIDNVNSDFIGFPSNQEGMVYKTGLRAGLRHEMGKPAHKGRE